MSQSSAVTITPYGGLGEIGMNCMLIETAQDAILIDCGLMFSELDHFGVEFVVPNFTHLFQRRDKIRAIFATHGHEDHIGAIPFLFKAGIRAPIYSSHFTSLMIRQRLAESGLADLVELNILHSGGSKKFGSLKVTCAAVNHSIIDAFALFIDTPQGKIVHTGDFKLGETANLGNVMEWKMFQQAGEEGVLLLMSDSTNVETTHAGHQEPEIVPVIEKLMRAAEGYFIITMFSSNIGRVANYFKLAQKMGKKVAITGRSMEQNLRLAQERGNLHLDSGLIIPLDKVKEYDRNKVVILATGCQGEPRSALNRMAHDEHSMVKLEPEDTIVFSSSQIPGNETSIQKLVNQLFKSGPQVIYDSIEAVHSTGHATRPELKKVLETIRPKYFVPIHGEYRHLVHHGDLAIETGVDPDHVWIIENGQRFQVTDRDGIEIVEEVTELKTLLEDREGQEITKSLLKDRKKLAMSGMVVCLMVREKETGNIISKPELISKGLVAESFEQWMHEEALKVVDEEIQAYRKNLRRGFVDPDFAENVRIGLRRFFDRNVGRKPTVLPWVLDV